MARNLDEVVEILQTMVKAEITISELYKTCADTWPEEKSFWLDLADEEMIHAQAIELIVGIFSKEPEWFKVTRPLNVTGLKTFIAGIAGQKEKIKKGEVSKKNMLFAARDIEQAIIESKYFDFLTSDHPEYKKLVNTIIHQTRAHREKIIHMSSACRQ